MIIRPPPSPFLDARDLNARYATQIRKLSNQPFIEDGDVALHGVDTFRPAHELEPGLCADAVNKRFEDGRAWPRFGAVSQAWGFPSVDNLVSGNWPGVGFGGFTGVTVQGLVVGQQYLYVQGNAAMLSTLGHLQASPPNIIVPPGIFTATATEYSLESHQTGVGITAGIYALSGDVQGFVEFNDPQGFDVLVLATDDWRDNAGEDGGRGRCWKVQSGNAPAAVPMNGNDVYGITRLIPCYNGLVMLRQDNERHYFGAFQTYAITGSSSGAATLTVAAPTSAPALETGDHVSTSVIMNVNWTSFYVRLVAPGTIALYDTLAHAQAGGATGLAAPWASNAVGTLSLWVVDAGTIQLNCEPDWANGDLVLFHAEPNSYFLPAAVNGSVPNPDSRYYVKNLGNNQVQLFTDAALTQQLNFDGAYGQFYLERQADFPGYYGNGAPPLIAQPNVLGATLWDVGFLAVPVDIGITSVMANVVTAPNHRLLPGDAVTVTGLELANGGALASTLYANPTSPNTLYLYDTSLDALAGGPQGQQGLANATPAAAYLVKAGASGLPMPPGTEGAYFQNRLLIVNGASTLVISDPLDPLHYSPLVDAVTANLGESDPITGLHPLPAQDAVLVLKQLSVLILNNFSGGPNAWTLTKITSEYGCLAPLSIAQVGSDVWFLSRQGVASVTQTIQGLTQGVALPVSKAMKKYVDLIDWTAAAGACGCYWNNRYFLAVPLKGQQGTKVNNAWLVFNFLNQMWEGMWQGAALPAAGMARHVVFGDERLCWLTPAGTVNWLGDGFTDGPTPIADSLTTRIYLCGMKGRKLHLATEMTWDDYMPSLTVTAMTPGVNETETLLPAPVTYDPTQYAVDGLAAYVPGVGDPQAPYREDYEMSVAELLKGGAPDTHQNHTEGFRMRMDDWGVQFTIANAQGSCRIQSIGVKAVAGPNRQTAQV
jgi:hypothetical protein